MGMAPFYRGYEVKPKLNEDDIKAIQALYGKKTDHPTNVPLNEFDTDDNVNEIEDDSPICQDPEINAIVTVKDNTTYVFKDKLYYKLSDDSVADGYPRSISSDWSGLPSNIDAAFTWKNGKTYFFKGDKYWRFTNQNKDTGYPKPIKKGFDGIPDSVDAAFVWSGNGKIYFFKGTQYWRFDPDKRPPVSPGYPKYAEIFLMYLKTVIILFILMLSNIFRPISNWEGIPDYV